MAPSQPTLKMLFAESRGRCGAPGCHRDIVAVDSQGDRHLIAEVAHIVSKSPRGPRGADDPGAGGYDGEDNLIVLCPTHHTEIDSMTEDHKTDRLRDWKQLLRTRMGGLIATLQPDPPPGTWAVTTADPRHLAADPALTDATPDRQQYEILRAHGAQDLHISQLGLTLYNASASAFVVRHMRAEVEARSPAPVRARLQHPTAGAALASVFRINLTDPNPRAVLIFGENDLAEPPETSPRDRARITLAPGEVHDCLIEAFTSVQDVEWRLALDLVHEGTNRTLTLGLSGEPIRTAGMPDGATPEVWLLPGIAGPVLHRAPGYEW